MPKGEREGPSATQELLQLLEKFAEHTEELDEKVKEVCYWLERLPEAQGIQPQGRNHALALRAIVEVCLAARLRFDAGASRQLKAHGYAKLDQSGGARRDVEAVGRSNAQLGKTAKLPVPPRYHCGRISCEARPEQVPISSHDFRCLICHKPESYGCRHISSNVS